MVILGSSLTFMVLVMNRKEQNLSRGFVTVMLMTLLIDFFWETSTFIALWKKQKQIWWQLK